MNIIGQKNTIEIIKRFIINSLEDNIHILLVAPSGHGKTLLGRFSTKLIAYLKNKKIIYFPTGENFITYYRKNKRFHWKDYVVFIDEIHLLVEPEEMFPLFEKTDIISATNVMGLPEALENRFTKIPLQRYNDEELKEIFELYYGKRVTDELMEQFLNISRTPRKLKEIAKLYSALGEDFWKLVVNDEGLTQDELEYINALRLLGGQSSFSRIRAYLGYSPKYIQQIETRLLEKGKIAITSKGRILKEVQNVQI